jgi:hypothetical protein
MTCPAALAGLLAPGHFMTLPAILMNDDFCADGLIGDIRRRGMMAIGAGLGPRPLSGVAAMAYQAINPEIIKIIFMRHHESGGIDFVMTGLAADFQVIEVEFVGKHDLPHG